MAYNQLEKIWWIMNLTSIANEYDSNVLDCKVETDIFSIPSKESFPTPRANDIPLNFLFLYKGFNQE
jgi:hypothetical protein